MLRFLKTQVVDANLLFPVSVRAHYQIVTGNGFSHKEQRIWAFIVRNQVFILEECTMKDLPPPNKIR